MKHIKWHCIELTIATLISKPISSTCTTIGETFIRTSSSILTRIRDTVSNIWSHVIHSTYKSRDTVSNIWSHVIHSTYKSRDTVSNIWSHVIHSTYKSRDTVSNIWSNAIHCTYKSEFIPAWRTVFSSAQNNIYVTVCMFWRRKTYLKVIWIEGKIISGYRYSWQFLSAISELSYLLREDNHSVKTN
jgi:phage-related protein